MPIRTDPRTREAWMDLALAALDRGVLALDDERRVVFLNRRAEEILGRTGDELAGREILAALGARDDRWLDPEGDSRLGEPDAERVLRFEIGGREVALRSEPSAMFDARGVHLGTTVLLEEEENDPDLEQARKTDRLISLGELSAYVAHEIRNPLTGIRTTVQFVGAKLDAADDRRADLADVIAEIDRIEQIITSLLIFARPPIGKPAATQVTDVVRRALDSVAPQCGSAGIAVDTTFADIVPLVRADPDMLLQVFINLALNAVQAMASGGTLAVGVNPKRTRYRRNMVEITLADTGSGIAPEALEKIFAPFYTTRSTGTGLGLAISQQIVREYDGLISATNRPGGGAQFRVLLPGLSARQAAHA